MQDGGFTSLVEMYDTESNEWHNVENMGEARCNPGRVVGSVSHRNIRTEKQFKGASAHSSIPTLLYSPWEKKSYSKSFKSS